MHEVRVTVPLIASESALGPRSAHWLSDARKYAMATLGSSEAEVITVNAPGPVGGPTEAPLFSAMARTSVCQLRGCLPAVSVAQMPDALEMRTAPALNVTPCALACTIAELASAANAMIARLREEEAMRDQSDGARRDLVAAVSHDLRTPITSLRLLAEAVEDGIVDEDTRRGYLERMRTHIDALSALIDESRMSAMPRPRMRAPIMDTRAI